jgi:hypothetical protein
MPNSSKFPFIPLRLLNDTLFPFFIAVNRATGYAILRLFDYPNNNLYRKQIRMSTIIQFFFQSPPSLVFFFWSI